MVEVTKASPAQAGCWVDGHWGQYGTARMIEIAAERGWADQATIDLAAKHLASMSPRGGPNITGTEFEQMMWKGDDAEAWLNDNVAPEGHSFGWHDGEFFLWATEQWEEAD